MGMDIMKIIRKGSCWLITAFSILAIPLLSFSETIVGGFITTDTTWAASNSPYVASQSVVVMSGAKLTVEPGVEVRFDPDTALSINDGTLIARGTDAIRDRSSMKSVRIEPGVPGSDGSCEGLRSGDGTPIRMCR
jgi:hypothetical protein